MLEISFRCIMSCMWNAQSDLGVVLLNHSGTDDTRKMLVRICYSFPCVPCPCSTWTLGTKYWIQHHLSVPSHWRGVWGLWEWLCWCCVGQSRDRALVLWAAAACPDTSAPRAGAVFCWAWVTLAEMSAEPALALSAFTVSCKVNQMLLCDDKCYSWGSSWRRLSIRPVLKWTTSPGVLLCWSSAECGAPGSCAAPGGSSGRMLWVPFETFPASHRKRLLFYWVELFLTTPEGLALRAGWSQELCFVGGRSCLELVP